MQSNLSAPLSAEETTELQRAESSGAASVQLYRGGVFSEPDFVRFGVLQRLEIRRLMVCEGLVRPGRRHRLCLQPAGAGAGAHRGLTGP